MKIIFATIGGFALIGFTMWGLSAAGDLIRQRDDWAVIQGYMILASILGCWLALAGWGVKKVFLGSKESEGMEKVSVRKEGDKWISS